MTLFLSHDSSQTMSFGSISRIVSFANPELEFMARLSNNEQLYHARLHEGKLYNLIMTNLIDTKKYKSKLTEDHMIVSNIDIDDIEAYSTSDTDGKQCVVYTFEDMRICLIALMPDGDMHLVARHPENENDTHDEHIPDIEFSFISCQSAIPPNEEVFLYGMRPIRKNEDDANDEHMPDIEFDVMPDNSIINMRPFRHAINDAQYHTLIKCKVCYTGFYPHNKWSQFSDYSDPSYIERLFENVHSVGQCIVDMDADWNTNLDMIMYPLSFNHPFRGLLEPSVRYLSANGVLYALLPIPEHLSIYNICPSIALFINSNGSVLESRFKINSDGSRIKHKFNWTSTAVYRCKGNIHIPDHIEVLKYGDGTELNQTFTFDGAKYSLSNNKLVMDDN